MTDCNNFGKMKEVPNLMTKEKCVSDQTCGGDLISCGVTGSDSEFWANFLWCFGPSMSFFATFCFLCFWLAVGNALADRIVMASSGVKGLGFLCVKGSSLRPTGSFWILVRRWLSGMSWCNGTFWTSSVLGLKRTHFSLETGLFDL